MDTKIAQAILDKIVGQVFGYQNQMTLEQFQQKFAFDVRLPQKVVDATTGQDTWTQAANPSARFISVENAWKRDDWERPAKPLNSMEDVMAAWNEINLTVSDRFMDCQDILESDNIYSSERVYRSQDVTRCKDVLFSDGITDCEYVTASQRANTSTYCIRLEDANSCSNSFSVTWSKKIVNSFFIQNCTDMQDSMFCSHVGYKQYCIANMQYSEEDYKRIKDMVLRWILSN